jgi:hypothetical protein
LGLVCSGTRRQTMTNISRLSIAIALAAAAAASPAFAQSFDPELGTGNTLPFSFPTTAPQSNSTAPAHHVRSGAATPRNGLNAFALVPQGGQSGFDAALTGGGSVGYNENLRRDQW